MEYEVTFPGGVKVDVSFDGHTVATDQPRESGGEDSAPAPFKLFLASIAACAGLYALRFCQQRGIGTEGLKVSMDTVSGVGGKGVSDVVISVGLPKGFPEKYGDALVNSVNSCAVKRQMANPPKFTVELSAD